MVTCRQTSPLYQVTTKAAMELVGSGRVAHLSHHLTLHTTGWVSKRNYEWTTDRDGPYFADFCYL